MQKQRVFAEAGAWASCQSDAGAESREDPAQMGLGIFIIAEAGVRGFPASRTLID